MATEQVLGPFRARPLRPIANGPGSIVSGHLEPLGSKPIATGGWPGPIIRRFSFATLLPPTKTVNQVTGVKTNPGNYRPGR